MTVACPELLAAEPQGTHVALFNAKATPANGSSQIKDPLTLKKVLKHTKRTCCRTDSIRAKIQGSYDATAQYVIAGPCGKNTKKSKTITSRNGSCSAAISRPNTISTIFSAAQPKTPLRRPSEVRRKAAARRKLNREKDEVVMCPLCLQSPWGRGRLCNARDHIKNGRCEGSREKNIARVLMRYVVVLRFYNLICL